MYIKNIFDVHNYKGLEDGFKVNFDDITYIIGDNAKNKTTIGSIPLWIFTGYNLYGSNKEQVGNDNNFRSKNTLASMTFIDNNGSEHTITRCKGKDNFVMLDGIRTTQEVLARFYKDVHSFICAYNPNYFRSMSLSKQRELLLRILPTISPVVAFNLLEDTEKEILENPVVDIKGFCKAKREEIKELNSELERIKGNKDIYIDMAIRKEETFKKFDKALELNNLENEYERLIINTGDVVNIEDLEKDIKKLNEKIKDNINIHLKELQTNQQKELEKLKNVDSETSTCPTCKQEIKNENLIKALKITYKRNVNLYAEKIAILKKNTEELVEKRKIQLEKYEDMKNPEIQEKVEKVNALKEKIEILQKEKLEVDLYNKEISINQNQIKNAKTQIENLDKLTEEILNKIDKYNKQLKIVTRLNLLMMKEQMNQVKEYLNNVTIEFSRIDPETGEITDVYDVKYNGRSYEKLSKSYKIRADIEIANLINIVTGIKTPMFIDDVESITEISLSNNIQTILSIVVKYNDLEVLYSYPDVLVKQRDSINRKIEENEEILLNAA